MSLKVLYESLSERRRPEDIAEVILSVLDTNLDKKEIKCLEKAAKGSLKRKLFGYTSMLQRFAKPIGANTSIKTATEIFKLEEQEQLDYTNPCDITTFLEKVSPIIHKNIGENNFLSDRLNKGERKEKGLDISKNFGNL